MLHAGQHETGLRQGLFHSFQATLLDIKQFVQNDPTEYPQVSGGIDR